MRTRSVRKVRRKANWPLRILIVAGVAFLFIQLWRSQDQLSAKLEEKEQLSENIRKQTVLNEDLEAQKEDSDAILEKKANEAGFYLPGQQIYMEG